MKSEKKRVLIFASSYPWSENPVYGIFIRDFVYSICNRVQAVLLTPKFPGTADNETEQGVKIRRFSQCCPESMPIAGFPGGILPALKRHPVLLLFLPFFLLSEFLTLGKVIREEKIELVHAHWLIPQGFLAALWKKYFARNMKLILTCHGSDINKVNGGVFAMLKRFALKQADEVIAVSPDMKEKIESLCSECKCHVQPMGVDTALFRPAITVPDIPRKYVFNGPYVLFAGSLFALKGVRALLEAWPAVLKKNGNIHLLFAGNGELKEELQQRAEMLKITRFVHFAGMVPHDELPPYFSQCRAFILPSFSEGFGLVALEALACNVPVIISNLPSLLNYPPLKGIFHTCKAGDADSIAAAVTQVLTQPDSSSVRAIVEQHLSLHSVAGFYLGLYEKQDNA